jgi:hypothetical protein
MFYNKQQNTTRRLLLLYAIPFILSSISPAFRARYNAACPTKTLHLKLLNMAITTEQKQIDATLKNTLLGQSMFIVPLKYLL